MNSASRLRIIVTLLFATTPTTACGQESRAAAVGMQSPAALFRVGEYQAAIAAAERAVGADSSDPAGLVLVRALTDVGRCRDAIAVGERIRDPRLMPRLAVHLARAHRCVGADTRAAELLAGVAMRGPDSLMARYELARVTFDGGNHEAAMRVFDGFIDVYNDHRPALRSGDLRAVALAVRMLARRDPQLSKDALRAFDQANAADTMELDGRVQLADLLLEKFNFADARRELEIVRRVNPNHPGALLLLARVDGAEGRSSGAELIAKSLEVNATNADANAAAAMQLVDVERYSEAVAAAQKGLVVDTAAPAPWIVIAAARFLSGDRTGHDQALTRAHAGLPRSAQAEVVLAEVMARNRLYKQAAAFAAVGVARDSLNSRALAVLGINEMRIGQVNDGRNHLARAFALDPFDVWAKNTLDLLDTYKDYSELKTPRFLILAETKDAALLELFVGPLAEAAFDSLSARYAFTPELPVRVEMFRSSEDFSVRAVGLGGLGALGVSFGNVVAMDSPAARKVGEFNWGSTLWHELTHTFTLGVTGNRVPRWVSEGLSVYEERRARPAWGADLSPSLVAAWKARKLHPVSQLNNGFIRPRYPEEVGLSYALASYVCEMIETEYGIAGIRRFLGAFREGKNTNQAFEDVARVDVDAFDRQFDDWFRRKFATEFKSVDYAVSGEGKEQVVRWEGPLFATMRSATTAIAGEQWDQAARLLAEAKAMFPMWADEGSPYHLLAELHLKRGNKAAAARELAEIATRNESAFQENRELAGLLKDLGDNDGATAALERTLFITPFDGGVHDTLASIAASQGLHALAVRSRQALVALRPTDRAEALFQLAVAMRDAGDVTGARREVLRALDLAPNFEKAQELLLSLRRPEGSR